MKQEGWQLQRTKESPCQFTYFVARPAGFDGRLLQQLENSVPENFNREMTILQIETEKMLPPSLLVFLQNLPHSIGICSLQVSIPVPACRVRNERGEDVLSTLYSQRGG